MAAAIAVRRSFFVGDEVMTESESSALRRFQVSQILRHFQVSQILRLFQISHTIFVGFVVLVAARSKALKLFQVTQTVSLACRSDCSPIQCPEIV